MFCFISNWNFLTLACFSVLVQKCKREGDENRRLNSNWKEIDAFGLEIKISKLRWFFSLSWKSDWLASLLHSADEWTLEHPVIERERDGEMSIGWGHFRGWSSRCRELLGSSGFGIGAWEGRWRQRGGATKRGGCGTVLSCQHGSKSGAPIRGTAQLHPDPQIPNNDTPGKSEKKDPVSK